MTKKIFLCTFCIITLLSENTANVRKTNGRPSAARKFDRQRLEGKTAKQAVLSLGGSIFCYGLIFYMRVGASAFCSDADRESVFRQPLLKKLLFHTCLCLQVLR